MTGLGGVSGDGPDCRIRRHVMDGGCWCGEHHVVDAPVLTVDDALRIVAEGRSCTLEHFGYSQSGYVGHHEADLFEHAVDRLVRAVRELMLERDRRAGYLTATADRLARMAGDLEDLEQHAAPAGSDTWRSAIQAILAGRYRRSDREPQPGDGPDYHADHAAWERRRAEQTRSGERP